MIMRRRPRKVVVTKQERRQTEGGREGGTTSPVLAVRVRRARRRRRKRRRTTAAAGSTSAQPGLLCRRGRCIGGRRPRRLFADHLRMDLFQFPSLDLLGPEQRDEARGRRRLSTQAERGRARKGTYVQRCRRHRSRSSPAAAFCCSTSSMRLPMAARDSFKMATLSSRGMSPPESFKFFYARA